MAFLGKNWADIWDSGVWADDVWDPFSKSELFAVSHAYFKLDETSGTNATNETGTDGTYTNMDPATDTVAAIAPDSTAAMSFDGVNDFISGPAEGLGDVDQSVSLWLKTTTVSDYFFSAGDNGGGGGISLYVSGGGLLGAVLNTTAANVPSITINDDVAHHVVVTFDASTNTLEYYLDGTSITTNSGTGACVASDNIVIGARANTLPTVNLPFAGTLDEVGYFDTLLTASQVAVLNSGSTGPIVQTLPAVTQQAVGGGATTGTTAQTLPSLSQTAAGTLTTTGTAVQTLPAISQQAVGGGITTGTAAQTLPSLSQAAAGTVTTTGTAAQTLPTITQEATGADSTTGTAAQTLQAVTQAAAGTTLVDGTAAQTLPAATQQAVGSGTTTGTVTQLLPFLSQALQGTSLVTGTIGQTLPSLAQTGQQVLFFSQAIEVGERRRALAVSGVRHAIEITR